MARCCAGKPGGAAAAGKAVPTVVPRGLGQAAPAPQGAPRGAAFHTPATGERQDGRP